MGVRVTSDPALWGAGSLTLALRTTGYPTLGVSEVVSGEALAVAASPGVFMCATVDTLLARLERAERDLDDGARAAVFDPELLARARQTVTRPDRPARGRVVSCVACRNLPEAFDGGARIPDLVGVRFLLYRCEVIFPLGDGGYGVTDFDAERAYAPGDAVRVSGRWVVGDAPASAPTSRAPFPFRDRSREREIVGSPTWPSPFRAEDLAADAEGVPYPTNGGTWSNVGPPSPTLEGFRAAAETLAQDPFVTASGEALDLLGRDLGLVRPPGMTDATFRGALRLMRAANVSRPSLPANPAPEYTLFEAAPGAELQPGDAVTLDGQGRAVRGEPGPRMVGVVRSAAKDTVTVERGAWAVDPLLVREAETVSPYPRATVSSEALAAPPAESDDKVAALLSLSAVGVRVPVKMAAEALGVELPPLPVLAETAILEPSSDERDAPLVLPGYVGGGGWPAGVEPPADRRETWVAPSGTAPGGFVAVCANGRACEGCGEDSARGVFCAGCRERIAAGDRAPVQRWRRTQFNPATRYEPSPLRW